MAINSVVLFAAAEVTIGVLGLFRPPLLVIRNSERALTVTEPITVDGRWTVEVPGRIARDYRGRIAVAKKDGILVATVAMDVEAAVAAVVAAEMPADAPPEALKAMAVMARSFYLSAERRHRGYDFCDTTHCQFHRDVPAATHPAARAAVETKGIVVSYRGRGFAPLYSAACGGRTMRAEDVGLSADSYPWFPVRCEWCLREEPVWRKTVPVRDAAALLRARSESARLEVVRRLGWSAAPGNNYRVTQDGDVLVLIGRGRGHGVGLCQRGAIGMAAAGANFRDILRVYLPDTTLQ